MVSFNRSLLGQLTIVVAGAIVMTQTTQGQIVYTSAARRIEIESRPTVPLMSQSSSALGLFDESLTGAPRDEFNRPGRLCAAQSSELLSDRITMSLTADTRATEPLFIPRVGLLDAVSELDCRFAIHESIAFFVSFGPIGNTSGGGQAVVGLLRELPSGTTESVFNMAQPGNPIQGTLAPGQYRLIGRAGASSGRLGLSPSQPGIAQVVATLVVPGPTSAATVTIAAFAANARRRRVS